MQIDDRYNGIKQSVASTRIGNIALPNYKSPYFLTKTAPAMSDAAYKNATVAQAKKDAAAGKSQSQSSGYLSLMKSYVSVVSPDRQAIISSGLNQIFGKSGKFTSETPLELRLVEIILGTGKNANKDEKKQPSYIEFRDENGNMIANYSNIGWNMYTTDAENARTSEFLHIYNEAWAGEYHKNDSVIPGQTFSDDSVSFDMTV